MVTRFIFIDDAFVVNLRNIAIQIIIIVGHFSGTLVCQIRQVPLYYQRHVYMSVITWSTRSIIMINSGGVKVFFHSQQVDIAGGKDDNFEILWDHIVFVGCHKTRVSECTISTVTTFCSDISNTHLWGRASWSYGSWIYNYLCNAALDEVYSMHTYTFFVSTDSFTELTKYTSCHMFYLQFAFKNRAICEIFKTKDF
jgi:hypothetical protein